MLSHHGAWYLVIGPSGAARVLETQERYTSSVGNLASLGPKPGTLIRRMPDDEVPERIWVAIARLRLEGKI